jgi:hypothetical protein
MPKRFWKWTGIPRNEVTECHWCENPPIFQEIDANGYYVGACRAHKEKLKTIHTEWKERSSQSV